MSVSATIELPLAGVLRLKTTFSIAPVYNYRPCDLGIVRWDVSKEFREHVDTHFPWRGHIHDPILKVEEYEIVSRDGATDEQIEAALGENHHFTPVQTVFLFASARDRTLRTLLGYLPERSVSLSYWLRWNAETHNRLNSPGPHGHVGINRWWHSSTRIFRPAA